MSGSQKEARVVSREGRGGQPGSARSTQSLGVGLACKAQPFAGQLARDGCEGMQDKCCKAESTKHRCMAVKTSPQAQRLARTYNTRF